MIKAVILCHPQSKNLLKKDFITSQDDVESIKIACGTTKPNNVDFYEANDFFPNYASWNSALFETSVLLTVWEHADVLIGDNHVALLHTDIKHHTKPRDTWKYLNNLINQNADRPVGLTVNIAYKSVWKQMEVPESVKIFTPKYDPMCLHPFDNNIRVWDFIKKYDIDLYEWAFDVNPRLIYSHQFLTSRKNFDILGNKLSSIVNKLRLSDVGLWTPHVFERLIALYLAKIDNPILTTAFLHYSSSGIHGPGSFTLYGPRAIKYYKINSRLNNI